MKAEAFKIIGDYPVENVMNSGYIPIKDVLAYSFGKHRAVLMLRAYLDESGASHDSSFVCMGGCLASLDSWTLFEEKWKSILYRYGVSWLHMTDFEAYQGEFRGWTRIKHDDFLGDLMPVILQTIQLYIGASEDAWAHSHIPEPKDDPYFNCLLTCIDCAASYVSNLDDDEKVEMIFADHPEFGRRVRRLYPEIKAVSGFYSRLASDTYGSPKDFLPLQAADLIAFEFRKERERRADGCKRPMRWPLQQLIDKHWCNRGYFTFHA